MLNMNLKDNIKGYSHFVYYRENSLWYRTATDMIFPVPISDIGDAHFLPMEKSIIMMRWIRRFIDSQAGE